MSINFSNSYMISTPLHAVHVNAEDKLFIEQYNQIINLNLAEGVDLYLNGIKIKTWNQIHDIRGEMLLQDIKIFSKFIMKSMGRLWRFMTRCVVFQ